MRRTVIVLSLSLAVAALLLMWAVQPITDPLGRSCGGGICSGTAVDPSDDSFMDVCDGLRHNRQELIEPLAIAAGLASILSAGWMLVLTLERRNVLT